jgi:hypothetical protein
MAAEVLSSYLLVELFNQAMVGIGCQHGIVQYSIVSPDCTRCRAQNRTLPSKSLAYTVRFCSRSLVVTGSAHGIGFQFQSFPVRCMPAGSEEGRRRRHRLQTMTANQDHLSRRGRGHHTQIHLRPESVTAAFSCSTAATDDHQLVVHNQPMVSPPAQVVEDHDECIFVPHDQMIDSPISMMEDEDESLDADHSTVMMKVGGWRGSINYPTSPSRKGA